MSGRGLRRNPGVAAARQSAANCDRNSNGGFLPKAATPKADRAHPHGGRTCRVEAQRRRMGTHFLNLFWDGRPGQMAFEFLLSESDQMFSTDEEIKFVIEPQISPFCGPLCFTRSLKSAVGNVDTNGSFGLVDTGKKKLLATCYHVWDEFEKLHHQCPELKMCIFLDRNPSIGARGIVLDFQSIDQDKHFDLVTFDIEPLLSECRNRKFYPLNQNPARRVEKGDQLVFLGYPGVLRSATVESVEFGSMVYAVEVSSVDGLIFHSDGCSHGAGRERGVAGECQLRGEEQFFVELPRIGAGRFGQAQSAGHG